MRKLTNLFKMHGSLLLGLLCVASFVIVHSGTTGPKPFQGPVSALSAGSIDGTVNSKYKSNSETINVGNTITNNVNVRSNNVSPNMQFVVKMPKRNNIRKKRLPTEEEVEIKRKFLELFEKSKSDKDGALFREHLGRAIEALNPKYIATQRVKNIVFSDPAEYKANHTDGVETGSNELESDPEQEPPKSPEEVQKELTNSVKDQINEFVDKFSKETNFTPEFLKDLGEATTSEFTPTQLVFKKLLQCVTKLDDCNLDDLCPKPENPEAKSEEEKPGESEGGNEHGEGEQKQSESEGGENRLEDKPEDDQQQDKPQDDNDDNGQQYEEDPRYLNVHDNYGSNEIYRDDEQQLDNQTPVVESVAQAYSDADQYDYNYLSGPEFDDDDEEFVNDDQSHYGPYPITYNEPVRRQQSKPLLSVAPRNDFYYQAPQSLAQASMQAYQPRPQPQPARRSPPRRVVQSPEPQYEALQQVRYNQSPRLRATTSLNQQTRPRPLGKRYNPDQA